MPFIDNELYNDSAVSEELGGKPVRRRTLAKWRVSGDGPEVRPRRATPLYRDVTLSTGWRATWLIR